MNNLAENNLNHSKNNTRLKNVELIHAKSKGIICVAQSNKDYWKQQYCNIRTLEKKIDSLDNLDNIFFCHNTFKRFKRSTENLLELNACYIDIDCYRINITKEQALHGIDTLVAEHHIPRPTMIIDSGHGLYAVWKIKPIPAVAIKLWRFMEEYLYSQLEVVGADRGCLDPVRLFRISDTFNCKYPEKKKVQIISYFPIEYDLHDLQDSYLKVKKHTKNTTQRRYNTIIKICNIYSLYCNRRKDILSLCKLRNYEMTGMRENILFLYRYYSCLQFTDEKAIELIEELNEKFTEPCKHSTVYRATRSAERAAVTERYNYSNSTLIKLLTITEEEQRATDQYGEYILTTIISKEEKYRRKNLKRRKARRNSQDNTQREQQVKDYLTIIKEMKELGMKQKEIAQELGMSVRNVQKYYSKLKNKIDV